MITATPIEHFTCTHSTTAHKVYDFRFSNVDILLYEAYKHDWTRVTEANGVDDMWNIFVKEMRPFVQLKNKKTASC